MTTYDELDDGLEPGAPVWAVFGDLMAGLLGAFVLILVCALGMQLACRGRSAQSTWRLSGDSDGFGTWSPSPQVACAGVFTSPGCDRQCTKVQAAFAPAIPERSSTTRGREPR